MFILPDVHEKRAYPLNDEYGIERALNLGAVGLVSCCFHVDNVNSNGSVLDIPACASQVPNIA